MEEITIGRIFRFFGKEILKSRVIFCIVFVGAVLLSILLSFGIGYYYSYQNQLKPAKNATLAPASLPVKTKPELRSPVDNLQLVEQVRETIGLNIGGIPVNIFYEVFNDPAGDSLAGRIAVYHAWNKIPGRNEGAFIIREDNRGPCLSKLIPITRDDGMRFVAEYSGCGDAHYVTITSFSFRPTLDLKNIKPENLTELSLNDYFSSTYLESTFQIIGWQDYNHLLVNQITYLDPNNDSVKKQELYLFNVDTKTKKLIHTIAP